MGIKTVAIHSDPDCRAVHVSAADEAVCVGPAASSKSYLNVPRILDAIRSTGAQAVHPGYGFLSENAAFAKVLEDNKIKFIGPSSFAIHAMGDKIESKELAIKAGVNTIPGYLGIVANDQEAIKIARDIGYPVMIKASAGGGGKGMRIAYNDEEVKTGFRLSKDEAKSSFGDDRLFVEKFIEDPRHIEIQLIADSHGNVAALPERECSIQRRNQKVIEESPSVLIDEKTRRAMQQQACMLASAVGYESAGTVEFLADKNRNFYFLEMNTRLQVEHPVTEMVTGLDLVELMIRVAAGEKLPSHLIGSHVPIIGHAFESRVYAEDPFRSFLPSTGRLSKYSEPGEAADRDAFLAVDGTIRADAGVTEGSEISMHYDPMICKLVTHGATRDDALDRMRGALDAYVVRGVGHNIPFLRDLCDHARFRSGKITTQFIKEEYPNGFQGVKLAQESQVKLAAVAAIMQLARSSFNADISNRSRISSSFENGSNNHVIVTLTPLHKEVESVDGALLTFSVSLHQEIASSFDPTSSTLPSAEEFDEFGSERVEWVCDVQQIITPTKSNPTIKPAPSKVVRLQNVDWSLDAPLFFAKLAEGPKPKEQEQWPSADTLRVQHIQRLPSGFRLQYQGATVDVSARSADTHELMKYMLPKKKVDLGNFIVSPMPGTLVSIAVKPGQIVEEGQELCIVEAMKMANVIRASRKGKLKSVLGKAGDLLVVDQVLVEYEAPAK
jgi:propionyl-CoA carboxylase alpha chain